MHFCEKIHWWYFRMPDFHRVGWLGKAVDKVLAMFVKRVLDRFLPALYARTSLQFKLNDDRLQEDHPRIICSLTSFPGRIEVVWIAIESLFRQTVPPHKIILWLSEEQFRDRVLPESLQRLRKKGLDIEFCQGDMKAHKKYLYALRRYPGDYIVTFDDDLYHDRHAIENLLSLKRKHPNVIVTNRAHRIVLSRDKQSIGSYRIWRHNTTFSRPSNGVVATGGCGTLYENKLLHPDFSDDRKIRQLCFHADDIWLKVMAHKQGTQTVTNQCYGKDPIIIGKTQTEKLVRTNVLSGGNDQQLADLMQHYNIQAHSFKD